MSKLDLKKEPFYKPKKLEILDIPPMNFLMIDGIGNPNTHQAFSEAVESLFSVSYTLKFMTKSLVDYTVMPLEGLWWADDMDIFLPDTENKDNWQWTVMIRQPDHLTPNHIHAAIEAAQRKKDLAVLPRFETYHEGLSAQLMHLGPYSEEGPTIAKLHAFINAQGYALSGKHHEIYLSDSRRTAPEKMRTILRQPIQKGG